MRRNIRCCGSSLFRLRTFRAAVGGSFFSRLGLGGIPFLFPLLYQIGLGFSPVQSGLLVMPQAMAAMGLKLIVPGILARFGYRTVLLANTLILGMLIMGFATIDVGTPVWRIVLQAFVLGFFTSTAIHQHEHAGVCRRHGAADQRRQHHRQHRPADVDQLRRRRRLADRRHLRARRAALAIRPR